MKINQQLLKTPRITLSLLGLGIVIGIIITTSFPLLHEFRTLM